MAEPDNLERLDDIERTGRVVDDALQGRALRGEGLEEAHAMATALRLRALDPAAATPDPRFVATLERRLEECAARQGLRGWPRRLMNRRRFTLGSLAAVLAGLALLGRANLRRAYLATQGWQPVAQVAALPEVGAMRFTLGTIEGFLMRAGPGVLALSAICTHQRCILQWEASLECFNCPCHGALFNTDGWHLSDGYSLALPPLPRFDVLVADGVAYVRTPAQSQPAR